MSKAVVATQDFVDKTFRGNITHGFEHAKRVRNWAVKIAKSEKFPDLELVEITSLLHDIGFSKTDKWKDHGKLGGDIAFEFLTKNKLLSKQKISKVREVISTHNNNAKSEDKLLCILRDADMLDMMGAVGIMRTFISQRERLAYDDKNIKGKLWNSSYKNAYKNYDSEIGAGGTIIDQLNFQMHCVKELTTEFARKEAKQLCKFVSKFILQLEKEIKSK